MIINLLTFKEIMKEFEPVLFENAHNYPLTSVELLGNGPYSHNILYIADSIWDLDKAALGSEISIVLTQQPESGEKQLQEFIEDCRINILLLKSIENENIVELVKNYYNYYQQISSFSHSLMDILFNEGSLQNIVEAAYKYLENPISIFDAGFQLIAANYDVVLKHQDPFHQLVLAKGCMDQQDIKNLNIEHIHEYVRKSKKPIFIKSKHFGTEKIASMISSTKNIGHIGVSAINRSFKDIDYEYMKILCRVVNQYLKKSEFVYNSKGFIYEYFLRDLLDGKMRDSKQFSDRLSYVDREFLPFMYCLVVETARTGAIALCQLQNTLDSLIPNASTLLYNEKIVILLTGRRELGLSEEEENNVRNFFCRHSLYCGISNSFSCIIELEQRYRQAVHAIEFGIRTSNKPGLFSYGCYFMDHISNNFMEKESPCIFCNTQLRFLMDYDKKHNKNFAKTLYMYLLYERNIALAAESMFIHRNTFAYRINKIMDLIHLNLDDPDTRRYILLSYELITLSAKLQTDDKTEITNI